MEKNPPSVTLNNADTATPSFTAPDVTTDTDYTLTLTVSDGTHSRTDTVVITVRDAAAPPTPTPAPPQDRTTITADSGDVAVRVPPLAAHVIALPLPAPGSPASTMLPGSLTVHTSYSGVPISVLIPAGTTMTSPAGWDGEIAVSGSAPSAVLASAGGLGRVTGIVTIGLPDGTLSFDAPVRVTFEGRAGDRAAFAGHAAGGAAVPVEVACESGDPALIRQQLGLQAADQCVRDAGDDLEVWTLHFSSIASIGSPLVCR